MYVCLCEHMLSAYAVRRRIRQILATNGGTHAT